MRMYECWPYYSNVILFLDEPDDLYTHQHLDFRSLRVNNRSCLNSSWCVHIIIFTSLECKASHKLWPLDHW